MIEILIVHGEYGNDILLWRDGERVTFARPDDPIIVEVDAGAGWDYPDWVESANGAMARAQSKAFLDAVTDAFADPPDREHISGWPEEETT